MRIGFILLFCAVQSLRCARAHISPSTSYTSWIALIKSGKDTWLAQGGSGHYGFRTLTAEEEGMASYEEGPEGDSTRGAQPFRNARRAPPLL